MPPVELPCILFPYMPKFVGFRQSRWEQHA
jgi:hypothetical protein